MSRGKALESCEHYSVQSNEWIPLAPLPVAIHGSGAALPNHVLCVAGGRTSAAIENRAWVGNLLHLLLDSSFTFTNLQLNLYLT